MRRCPRPAPALAAILLLALMLAGCSLLGLEEPEPVPEPVPAVVVDDPPKTLYAGVSDLPILADPAAASEKIGSVALNEELIRYRTTNGFAFVEVKDSGLTGWVDSTLLVEKATAPKPLPKGEDIPPEKSFESALPGTDEGPISETF